MPYKLVWPTDTTMHCHFLGKVGIGDLTCATDDFYNDIRVDRTRFAVWDFSEMDEFVVGKHEASEMAATDFAASAYLKPLKSAFVTNNPAFAELVRHYIIEMDAMGAQWTNRLFADRAEAMRWMASESK